MSSANLIITYKRLITEFANKYKGEYHDFDTQVICEKGKQISNVSDDILNGEIEISHYTAKSIFECFDYKMIFTFCGKECSLDFGIIFDHDIERTKYSFFELTNVVAQNDYRRYNNSYLYNETMLILAFDWLLKGIDEHFTAIKELAANMLLIKELQANLMHDIDVLSKCSLQDKKLLNSSYALFCKNEYPKAVQNYRKAGDKLTVYNKRTLDFMQSELESGNEKQYIAVPPEIDSLRMKADTKKRSIFEVLSFYLSFPFCIMLGAVPFVAIYFIYYAVIGSEYMIKPNIAMPIVPGVFAGIFLTMFFRKYILKFFIKDKFEEYIKVQKIDESKGISDTVVLSIFGGIIGIACIVFMVLCLNWNIMFMPDKIVDNSKLFSFASSQIEYSEISALYKINAFRNSEGRVYPNPSFALKLKDGRIIDFRNIGEPDTKTIEYLKTKGIKLEETEFIENIDK